jgi:hypothetical protein
MDGKLGFITVAVPVQQLLQSGFLSNQVEGRNYGGSGGKRKQSLEDIVRAHSTHAHEPCLIKALLVAGLYPNVAKADQKKKYCFARTFEDGRVSFHPSSVMHARSQFTGCATSLRLCRDHR